MWRRRLGLAGLFLGVAAGSAGTAHAGALAEVSRGLHKAAGTAGETVTNGGGGGDGLGDAVGHVISSLFSGGDSSSGGCCEVEREVTMSYAYATSSPSGGGSDVRTEVYLGGQSVEDSDGALGLEARATFEDFGLGLRGISYFERVNERTNEHVSLDVWWVSGLWRLDHGPEFHMWLELSLTGLSDPAGLSMTGAAAGLTGWRRLSDQLGVVGGLRHGWYEHGVHSNELFAGLQVSILQLSYRVMDFNVGPPLRGPEVGIVISF